MAEHNITYKQVDLKPDGSFDYDGIKLSDLRLRWQQFRGSKGYADRPTLSVEQIGDLISFMKDIKPDLICMVDNCYGNS